MTRHCEERSDEAIQTLCAERLDCFAALAMMRLLTIRYSLLAMRIYMNAWMPVWARPRISAWMSWVPS